MSPRAPPPTSTSSRLRRSRHVILMTAGTWWRLRCARDAGEHEAGARAVHPGAAHPFAVAGPSRTLAGRRGMAIPVLGGVLSAAVTGVTQTGRRGPAAADHAGCHSGRDGAAR